MYALAKRPCTNQPEATFEGCRPRISQKKCLEASYTINYIHTEVEDKRKICHNLCHLTGILCTNRCAVRASDKYGMQPHPYAHALSQHTHTHVHTPAPTLTSTPSPSHIHTTTLMSTRPHTYSHSHAHTHIHTPILTSTPGPTHPPMANQ